MQRALTQGDVVKVGLEGQGKVEVVRAEEQRGKRGDRWGSRGVRMQEGKER